MRIGVLGAGNMAEALGGAWAGAGHEVLVGGRDAARAAAAAERIGGKAGSLREAAGFGGVVLLAVPYAALADTLHRAGAGEGTLSGRTVVDCSNPLDMATMQPHPDLLAGGPSAARQVAALAVGAHVVKGFNLAPAEVWRHTSTASGAARIVVPLCGDDKDALAVVAALVRESGADPLEGGGLERAALLEAATAVAAGVWTQGRQPGEVFSPVGG
ncbi:NADPH-dependent F420 reductase [Streptomyces aculeolatus]|uniref:NADPH-dependent F420 reductase n=1 Tax=Streptomyces aculeolatus TaxID=270689 RepID=UPI001CED5F52|nr:NAD(P)-binding domain-containing protein [Streptomyces aculeolatus]